MTGAVPGGSGQARSARIARDVRQVLALAGLPEARGGEPGGYSVVTRDDGRVYVGWMTDGTLYNQAFDIEANHPQHPLARLDRSVTAVMERAVADVLYAAGFTVVLRPGVPNSNPDNASDPEVIVAACPEFRAWADS
jgi:hypothetical protein